MNANEPTPEAPHGAARPGITRRGVIAVAAGGLIAGTVVTLSGWTPQPKLILAPSGAGNRTPLPIPPLAEPEIAHDGTRIFSLTAQTGQSRIHPAQDQQPGKEPHAFLPRTSNRYFGHRFPRDQAQRAIQGRGHTARVAQRKAPVRVLR